MKKIVTCCFLIFSLIHFQAKAHITSSDGIAQHFTIQNKEVTGYFYLLKNNEVYIENLQHQIIHFPLSDFSKANQQYIKARYKKIQDANRLIAPSPIINKESTKNSLLFIEVLLGLGLLFIGYQFIRSLSVHTTMKYVYPIAMVALSTLLMSADKKYRSTTDPLQVDQAFIPFKPNVYTHWDGTWFYVESKGIPTTHGMMVGISNHGWQQQIPIPQCYTGSNAWQIPLNPIPAATPVPVSPNHFTRGAVAIAVNGVAIFNPYTNTGVDAFVDGQLDNYGGHCGRADDYHYHTAPLHLYGTTSDTLPIAYALDGYAVLGAKERDGSTMAALDANHGHSYGGTYHYHGTNTFPYMIGNMVGKVTEDTTFQIIPQAHANPIRPSGTPLTGALITGCTPNATNNGYVFTYTLNGETYTIDYSWTSSGVYTFNYITPTGTTTQTYNDFVPCEIPNAIHEISRIEKNISVYPNPTSDELFITLKGALLESDIRQIGVYSLDGRLVFNKQQFTNPISLKSLHQGSYMIKIQLKSSTYSSVIVKN